MDAYSWLRNRDDPRVSEFLQEENVRAEAAMAHTKPLQEALYREILSRIQETDASVPYRMGPYAYYTRTEEGQAYPIRCRRRGDQGPEEVLLDVNALAKGHEYTAVTAQAVSPDHRLLAYTLDHTGYERPTLRIKDLETGRHLPDSIEEVGSWSLAWGDPGTLFYTRLDPANRPDRLYRHLLGTPVDTDPLVHHEPDARFWLRVHRTRSRRYLVLSLGSKVTSEAWFLPADDPQGPFTLIAARRPGIEYTVDHRGDRFYILTNDGAMNFRVVEASPDRPGPEHWIDVVPHDPEVYLHGIVALAGHLVVSERRGGYRTFRVHPFSGEEDYVVEQPESVSFSAPVDNHEFETTTFRYEYGSLVTAETIFDFDLATRQRALRKQEPVLGGYEPSAYETRREWAQAQDGTRVPVSIVHRRGIPMDGSNPCLLSGYGAYGFSREPQFSSARLSLLDRGFVFAIAHVRGGSEMGRRWYEEGKFLSKKNTFTDFIAAAERLVALGYTRPEKLAARGGSAGGLLIGAVINLRPDLFRAVHAAVPFVDVVNTMMDPSLPLTVIEYEEWGDPNESEYYEYIKSYSPYDNVAEQDYPHLLATAGLNDPRVHFWEPAKWIAKLRERKTDENDLLLRTNMDSGHGGSSGRYGRLREIAFEDAFLIDRLGAPWEPRPAGGG